MIIDFHVHYTPPEMMSDQIQGKDVALKYEGGIPTFIYHPRLGNLAQHVEAMDFARIDLSVLSSGAGLMGNLGDCRLVNDRIADAVREYPGRFAGLVHIPPLGGKDAFYELERGVKELGFKGVAIESDIGGITLDSKQLWPFYEKVQELGIFVFIHPSLKALGIELMADYDLARSVGREFGLVMCTMRLINGGVFDDFPGLTVQMSHLGGGIAALMGRIRSYQDKVFWGTSGDARHGRLPQRPFDEHLGNIYFDTGGYSGSINAVKAALLEMHPGQVLLGTDYPQEIRDPRIIKTFVESIQALPMPKLEIDGILAENGKKLIGLD